MTLLLDAVDCSLRCGRLIRAFRIDTARSLRLNEQQRSRSSPWTASSSTCGVAWLKSAADLPDETALDSEREQNATSSVGGYSQE